MKNFLLIGAAGSSFSSLTQALPNVTALLPKVDEEEEEKEKDDDKAEGEEGS